MNSTVISSVFDLLLRIGAYICAGKGTAAAECGARCPSWPPPSSSTQSTPNPSLWLRFTPSELSRISCCSRKPSSAYTATPTLTPRACLHFTPQYPRRLRIQHDQSCTTIATESCNSYYSYDMTQGLAAAPWGLPVRFDPEQAYKGSIPGNWERPIGLFRTVYSWVAQLRPASEQSVGSVFYWAPHTPLGATYVRACNSLF